MAGNQECSDGDPHHPDEPINANELSEHFSGLNLNAASQLSSPVMTTPTIPVVISCPVTMAILSPTPVSSCATATIPNTSLSEANSTVASLTATAFGSAPNTPVNPTPFNQLKRPYPWAIQDPSGSRPMKLPRLNVFSFSNLPEIAGRSDATQTHSAPGSAAATAAAGQIPVTTTLSAFEQKLMSLRNSLGEIRRHIDDVLKGNYSEGVAGLSGASREGVQNISEEENLKRLMESVSSIGKDFEKLMLEHSVTRRHDEGNRRGIQTLTVTWDGVDRRVDLNCGCGSCYWMIN